LVVNRRGSALGVGDPDLSLLGIPEQRRRRALGDDLPAITRER
jgi:hypothetical protein